LHAGAAIAARSTGAKIYWNAPTREDDVQGQIALVEKVIDRGYQAMVLAPDQSLALIAPVRRALSKGIRTVIVGSALPIPPGGTLSYIINDDEEAGHMAAMRIAQLLTGKGSIAILGIDPDIAGVMIRGNSLEKSLLENYPQIHIADKRMGSFNVPFDQQIAEQTLRENPNLDGIVALTSASTRAACAALDRTNARSSVKVVGFDDPDTPRWFQSIRLDSLIIQDSREIGIEAVKTIAAQIQGRSVPAEVKIAPRLLTRRNLDSPEIRQMLSMAWRAEN
jgi:ribose transport system substrate-binding protein